MLVHLGKITQIKKYNIDKEISFYPYLLHILSNRMWNREILQIETKRHSRKLISNVTLKVELDN